MSKWDDFKKSVGVFADKTAAKTRELTDTASLKIKIATKEADRDSAYKKLGKLTYSKLKATDSKYSESLTVDISTTIDLIDKINLEIDELKDEEERRRAAKEAEKTARRNAQDQSDEDNAADAEKND